MTTSTSELWGQVIDMARNGTEATKAFRTIRSIGGRDLVKDEDEFARVYGRFVKHPMFAAHMLLTIRREEFQRDVLDAMWALTPTSDAQTDEYAATMQEFEKGSADALTRILDTVKVSGPTLTADLEARARTLYPRLYAELDARATPDQQLTLGLEAVEPIGTPAVSEGV